MKFSELLQLLQEIKSLADSVYTKLVLLAHEFDGKIEEEFSKIFEKGKEFI